MVDNTASSLKALLTKQSLHLHEGDTRKGKFAIILSMPSKIDFCNYLFSI